MIYTAAGGASKAERTRPNPSAVTGQAQREALSSGHSQTGSKSSRAAAWTKDLWTFRAAAMTGGVPAGRFWRARYSMALMHWLEPSVE